MGQYHIVVNLDKEEFIHPHKFGDGLKLMEFGNSASGTMCGLAILLAVSNGRGGGDLRSENELIGSWGGDRIVVLGDYCEVGDVLDLTDVDYGMREDGEYPITAWDHVNGTFTDISEAVRSLIAEDGYTVFTKSEWGGVRRTSTFDKEAMAELRPDMVIAGKIE